MAKLWQKNYTLDSMMEHFTVRRDYINDEELVLSDLIGSAAQAKGLERIGILSHEETEALLSGLDKIAELRKADSFPITVSDEDCHTAIEGFLTEQIGEAGKKIQAYYNLDFHLDEILKVIERADDLVKMQFSYPYQDRDAIKRRMREQYGVDE